MTTEPSRPCTPQPRSSSHRKCSATWTLPPPPPPRHILHLIMPVVPWCSNAVVQGPLCFEEFMHGLVLGPFDDQQSTPLLLSARSRTGLLSIMAARTGACAGSRPLVAGLLLTLEHILDFAVRSLLDACHHCHPGPPLSLRHSYPDCSSSLSPPRRSSTGLNTRLIRPLRYTSLIDNVERHFSVVGLSEVLQILVRQRPAEASPFSTRRVLTELLEIAFRRHRSRGRKMR